MNVFSKNENLIFEEVKAVKFFLWTFYILLIVYDYLYYFVYPFQTGIDPGFLKGSLGIWFYVILLLLLPVAIYLLKTGKPEAIKYIYLVSYILLDFINNLMVFWGTEEEFFGGHLIEVYFILFSPIFVNKRFFWLVTIGFIVKYTLFGVLLVSPTVIFPIVLIIFISLISWVLLSSFMSYIKAITRVHEDLRQQEKLAIIGQMATAIGHEVKNPLASLRGFIQLEQEKQKSDDKYFQIMLSEVDRINNIATDLLILGKPKVTVKNEVDLIEVIEYVVYILKQNAEETNVKLHIEQNGPIPKVTCDENQIKQVFINIIKNAIEAMSEGGHINIKLSSDESIVTVVVEDEGCGIPTEELGKIGEPFYTHKENGTGLGLMVTKKIIEEHEGTFLLESDVNRGTCITIHLPFY